LEASNLKLKEALQQTFSNTKTGNTVAFLTAEAEELYYFLTKKKPYISESLAELVVKKYEIDDIPIIRTKMQDGGLKNNPAFPGFGPVKQNQL